MKNVIWTWHIKKMIKLIRIINKTKRVSKTNLKYLCNNTNLDFSIIEKYLSKDIKWNKYLINWYNYYVKQDKYWTNYINNIYNKEQEKIIYFYINTDKKFWNQWNFSY